MNTPQERNGRASMQARSRPCQSCDYDLRGLPLEAKCPECGALNSAQPPGCRWPRFWPIHFQEYAYLTIIGLAIATSVYAAFDAPHYSHWDDAKRRVATVVNVCDAFLGLNLVAILVLGALYSRVRKSGTVWIVVLLILVHLQFFTATIV